MSFTRRQALWIILGFVLLILSVYGASLRNGFVGWDDPLLILQNWEVREFSFRSLKQAFTTFDPELYIPLTLVSYQIDHFLAGMNPVMFHFTSLVLHIINSLLVVWMITLLSHKKWAGLIVGLLFALHPLNVEAVAWASARKDVLSATFFLGSLVMFLRFRETQSRKRYWASLVLFLCALLSKVVVVGLPLILLLMDWRERRRYSWKEKLPFFVLSVIFGVVALFGKQEALVDSTILTYIAMGGKSMFFALQKLLLPIYLSILYPYQGTISLLEPAFFVPWIFLLSLTGIILWTLRWTREVVFGALFFLILLFPTLTNFMKAGDISLFSDRYTYLPAIGLFFLVGLGVVHFCTNDIYLQQRNRRMTFCIAAVLVVFLLYSGASMKRSFAWVDTEHLLDAVPNPDLYIFQNNRANLYRLQGRYKEAIILFQKGLEQKPDATLLMNNLGAVYRESGQLQEAEELYERAIDIDPENPESYFGLAILRKVEGRFTDAEQLYHKALELDEGYVEALVNLGTLYKEMDNSAKAEEQYRLALEQNPYHAQAIYNTGVLQLEGGDSAGALLLFVEAVRFRPSFIAAGINAGLLYAKEGRKEKAIEMFRGVLQYDSDNIVAIRALEWLGG